MASIVQRNKSFSVVYTTYKEGGKKQKWETYHSYEAALKRKGQIELIQAQQKENLHSHAETISDLLREYVTLYGRSHWSYSTYTNYVALMENHILPFWGEMRLTEFSPKIIATLYSRMRYQQNLTPQMLTAIHKLLHSAFEQAVLWEYADRNPFHKATLPKSFPCTMKMLSNEEIKRLLQDCGFSLLGIAVHLAFAGSLRKGEILALTWSDVDFKSGTICVNKTLKRVRKDAIQALDRNDILYQFPAVYDEGRTVIVLKRPKTRSSIRTVYLPSHVIDLLQDWKKAQLPCRKNLPDLILRYSSGRPLQEEALPRMLEKQLLALGLPKVTFHSLRHSSITYKLILTGGNIKAVQGDSGHAQAEMITERYGHVIDSCRKECAQNFQKEFYESL
nr:tyrosine-type recombinase/integrase [uncultured Dysosmobacter sp.]